MYVSKKRVLLVGVASLGFLFFSFLIPFLRSPLFSLIRLPLELVAYLPSLSQGGTSIFFSPQIFRENLRLKKEISLLKRQIFETDEVYTRNLRLQKLHDFKKSSPLPLVAARVIAWDPGNFTSLIIIDKGSSSGIKEEAAVLTNAGLVGRVIETSNSTSKVMLINDINSSAAARIVRSRQVCLVCGTLEGDLILRYLPKEADVQAGDLVVSSGLSSLYPKGILIGNVIRVRGSVSRLETYAEVRPAVKLNSLEEVLVVCK